MSELYRNFIVRAGNIYLRCYLLTYKKSNFTEMSLKKIYLRYYPPGIALDIGLPDSGGADKLKHIDLFELSASTSKVDELVRSIIADNELHSPEMSTEAITDSTEKTENSNSSGSSNSSNSSSISRPRTTETVVGEQSRVVAATLPKRNQPISSIQTDTFTAIKRAIKTLQRKLCEPKSKKFYLFKCLQEHILPLTNVCFDRKGERYLTCSYDRTCRVINTNTAEELHVFKGHDNVVFSATFNFPKCDKVVSASFDATAKVWSSTNGSTNETKPLSTLCGHSAEIVGVEFHPLHANSIVTASLDSTARLFDVETSLEMRVFDDHNAEVIASKFSRANENLLLTGSFDRTAVVRDIRQTGIVSQLRGHTAELSNCVWNYACNMIATGSLDGTARLWDLRNLENSIFIVNEHSDEVLDLSFDLSGKLLATCSSDCTARVWKTYGEFSMQSVMIGHAEEVSKVCFSPPGGLLLTASADRTARLWITETGECFQALTGHTSDVFSCAFSYTGDAIITASKDNTCRLWR